MRLLSFEHSLTTYYADLAAYGVGVLGLGLALGGAMSAQEGPGVALMVVLGLVVWTLLEYLIHRFVLHGLDPFRRWHAAHHQRPEALICTPTLLSALAFTGLVLWPSLAGLPSPWGLALSLGVLTGAFVYSLLHHALHHLRAPPLALRRWQRWHRCHHHSPQPVCYGVSTRVWDRLFGSAGR
ncbi:sterol desaturase family protein [Curvibacter sp. HBC61]|uniref:Sterol desaturase family protein n=1 Tax=Curvibacter cyanobacteriorum TaxID=3026422 RepID=A0ABT5MY91_9BURK|nr:sterol desaturase family protein [Curvibacter sp. HBC61]MDD0838768.1 sterol desaturase family protein [Curvibacter sp. HBC61]